MIFDVLITGYLRAATVTGYSDGCRLSKRLSCLNRGHSKRDTYTVIYRIKIVLYTGLFEMIVGVLTTCHTQYT